MQLGDIGSQLKSQRLAKDLTLEQVADGICSLSYLSLVESGKRTPSRRILRDLSFRLDMKLEQQGVVANEGFAKCLVGLRIGKFDEVEETIPTLKSQAEKNLISGLLADARGSIVEAVALLEGVFNNRAAGDDLRVHAAINLCRALANSGDNHYAMNIGEQALRDFAQFDEQDPELFFELKATLSNAYVAAGDLNRAMALVKDHGEHLHASKWQQVMSLWSQIHILENSGQLDEANRLSNRALQVLDEIEKPLAKASLLNYSAWLELKTGNANSQVVANKLGAAEAIFRDAKSNVNIAHCLDTQAMAESIFGSPEKTEALIKESLNELTSEQGGLRAVMLVSAAASYLRIGKADKCKQSLVEARSLLSKAGATRHEAQAWREMGGLFEELGDTQSALECLKAATDLLGLVRPSALETAK
ncbi:MAG: hypothetical protein RL556_544 [Actinomycetota bacterium]|jgi:tetratricopeptide (TPR) repeat protein